MNAEKIKELTNKVIDYYGNEIDWLFSDSRYKIEYIEKWVEIIFEGKLNESMEVFKSDMNKSRFENEIEQSCAILVAGYKAGIE